VELVNLKTLSKQVSLSVFTLRKYIKKAGLPHYRVGNKYLVNREEFADWLSQFQTTSSKQAESLKSVVDETLEKLHL
jgi:excisionase family DNA binding protein